MIWSARSFEHVIQKSIRTFTEENFFSRILPKHFTICNFLSAFPMEGKTFNLNTLEQVLLIECDTKLKTSQMQT